MIWIADPNLANIVSNVEGLRTGYDSVAISIKKEMKKKTEKSFVIDVML